jgi:hypothetical protein
VKNMAIQNFMNVFEALSELGVMDSLLPFLLIFTIIFAVLEKTQIIGRGRKQYNVIVSLVISLMVVIPHVTGSYPPGQDVIDIINRALPNVSVVIIAVILLLLLVGVFGMEWHLAGTSVGAMAALISVLIIVYIFGSAAGWWGRIGQPFGFLSDPDTQALVIIILVFGVVIFWITSGDGGAGFGGTFRNIVEDLRRSLR